MPGTSQNVRLQNLRDFTVQIRDTETDAIVGTGIAVSMQGQIVTCAHVVQAAGVDPQDANGAEVAVYFPQAKGGERKKHQAKIAAHFALFDDDMVLLQLESPPPLSPEQIAVLGTSDGSELNPFLSYGYCPVGDYPASRADGKILGSVEPPRGQNLQVDPIQLKSRQIAGGMSGAAVLDVERNLVVGLVAERYFPAGAVQDNISYGADSKILTFSPFDFKLEKKSLALRPAPSIKLDESLRREAKAIVEQAISERSAKDAFAWHAAPALLDEFTGREAFLAEITDDWSDPKKHITGLIGFGGEGKSSLARKWVSTLNLKPSNLKPPNLEPSNLPTGLFWWGFYENASVDDFFEAALDYMSGGKINPQAIRSASMRAQVIASMLSSGRYLFVLDGLEVMQHQEGDQYGLIKSKDLQDFLSYFAAPDHESFCLVTSRAPLLDLMAYTTYTHRDVNRLLLEDGIALLRVLGVKGDDEALGKIVTDWDGHALTVSLLGSYLAEHYAGDIAKLEEIPLPTADESRYERVHRVLRRYDENLSQAEREFLKLFAAFRTPVHEDALEKVFVPLLNLTAKNAENAEKNKKDSALSANSAVNSLVSRLLTYRLLRHDTATQTYTAHPLIRNHYLTLLTQKEAQEKEAHEQIKDYYLSVAGDTPHNPTLEDLRPLIEVVHHACQAGADDEADDICWQRIYQTNDRTIVNQIGAWETAYILMLNFFPNQDATQEPRVNSADNKRWILNEVGLCLMSLGRLREAIPFYERKNAIALEMEDWKNLSNGYQNLAELQASLGALEQSVAAARQALEFSRRAEDKRGASLSLAYLGSAYHLLGNMEDANANFQEAESLEQKSFLYVRVGILHADYLMRAKDVSYAKKVTTTNLEICKRNNWVSHISMCYRVLGDLDADTGNQTSAREHYESALKIARGISYQKALIEALLGRGRFYAKTSEVFKTSEVSQAFNDLNEALGYAVEGEYRIYEAYIRVALAWAYLALSHRTSEVSEKKQAKAEAERALQMSKEMGYHWGQVDAEEVLEEIGKRE